MLRIIKKFGKLLDKKQKQGIVIIVLMMVMGAFLETLGISLIIPLITVILDEDFFQTNVLAANICEIFKIESSKSFVILMLIALIMIFILKDVFLYFEYYVQRKFTCDSRVRVQKQLMESFLQRPYEHFLNESTGNIQRVIVMDVNCSFLLLDSLMTLFTELIVCIVVLGAVIMVDVLMATFVCLVLLAEVLFISKIVKPTMRILGKESREANGQTNKWIIQSVEGIKEIKVTGKQSFFIENYAEHAGKFAIADRKSKLISNAPRLIIEAVTISAMLGFMVLLLLMGYSMTDLLPQLSAFAVAAVRLLPSANRLSASMNNIPLWEPNLDALILNMDNVEKWSEKQEVSNKAKPQEELSLKESCTLSDITYAYSGAVENVLEHADMLIPVGKSIGIVGTSGAGKTTAVDILLGLLGPQEGGVFADGKNIMENYQGWLQHLSYIPQVIYMLDDTIAANVAFGNNEKDINEELVKKALREAQLEEFVQSLPEGIYTKIGERGIRLSGGQRQRIGIARALYGNPELLVFDEATSALDNETETAIMESINALHGKKTMIIIAHRLTTIQGCDIVYRVGDKKIVRER